MTDYKEEQEGELEALRCIYPEEELKGALTHYLDSCASIDNTLMNECGSKII